MDMSAWCSTSMSGRMRWSLLVKLGEYRFGGMRTSVDSTVCMRIASDR